MAPCLGEWVQKPSVADSAPYARTIMARMDQCAREQRAVFDAIVRQCRVLYGVHWEVGNHLHDPRARHASLTAKNRDSCFFFLFLRSHNLIVMDMFY